MMVTFVSSPPYGAHGIALPEKGRDRRRKEGRADQGKDHPGAPAPRTQA